MKKEVIELIQKEKIIAIVRGVDAEHILPTAEALYKGGIHLMEIAFEICSLYDLRDRVSFHKRRVFYHR